MTTDHATPETLRRLRHVALNGGALSASPGQQGHWTHLGESESVAASAPQPPVKLATPPTPAVTHYSMSGEIVGLLVGCARTMVQWLRSALRRDNPLMPSFSVIGDRITFYRQGHPSAHP